MNGSTISGILSNAQRVFAVVVVLASAVFAFGLWYQENKHYQERLIEISQRLVSISDHFSEIEKSNNDLIYKYKIINNDVDGLKEELRIYKKQIDLLAKEISVLSKELAILIYRVDSNRNE